MASPARLGLLGFSAFLLLFPLTLGKPGVPTHLKADEAAYYGMALSLAHDGDLAFEQRDVDRYFAEFPYGPVNNLILMSADGWGHVSYGKPYVYSLFAAPFARAFGADGVLCFNALLMVAMVWMGAAWLRRHNDDGIATLYALGFFVLSVGFAYVWWLQPEVFNMAAIAASLFLGLPREGAEEGLPRPRRLLLAAALSGAALSLAVCNKPMLALLGLAPLWTPLRERRWGTALAWLGGAAACLGLVAAGSLAWTGTPSSYLGVQRGGFVLCGPGQMPVFPSAASSESSPPAPAAAAAPQPPSSPAATTAASAAATPAAAPAAATGGAAAVAESPTKNAYSWLFRVPDTTWSEFADNVVYFLLGRHTGLLLYTPFAALSVLLFALHARRSVTPSGASWRWVLLGSTAAVALFFLLLIAWNWQGGGGFVGNRYFVNVYPAFLFLVTRIRPRAVVPVGFALAGLFLSPLLLSPFGTPGPEPTLQMHVRAVPFRWFPLELTLRNVPGYQRVSLSDFRLVGRRDVFLPLGEAMWVHGATPVELWLIADHELGPLAFAVSSPAPGNRIELALGGFGEAFELGAGELRQVVVPPQRPDRRWTIKTGTLHAYRMTLRSSAGRPRVWQRDYPPAACPGWPWQPKAPDSFYVGAELLYLGSPAGLGADVYSAQWRDVVAPPRAAPGAAFVVPATVRNASRVAWRNQGGARVRLAYHWLRDTPGGGAPAMVVRDGERTELPRPLLPGEEARVELRIVAPPEPGRYLLALDPVFETVAWFSEHDPSQVLRFPVEVAAGAPAVPSPSPPAAPAPGSR